MNFELLAQQIANQYDKASTGSPSRIGQADTLSLFLSAVQDGNYIETACELAGISKQTIYQWFKRADAQEQPYLAFRDAVKRAEARAEAAAVQNVRQAGKDPRFWAAEMTYLERRHPGKWARRNDDQNTPRVVVQIGIGTADVHVQTQIATSYTESDRLLSDSVASSLSDAIQT